jgi:hypothetical protein
MKKNFIKYIAALAVAPMLLSSCSDDFLNEIDPNRQTPTTFWTSEDNVMKGLSAVYNPFRRITPLAEKNLIFGNICRLSTQRIQRI